MQTIIARGISYVFHPLLIPTYTLLLLLNLDAFSAHLIPASYKLILLGVVMLTTFIIPAGLTWFLFRLGMISSVFLGTREERTYPVLSVAVFYYVCYYMLRGAHISAIFNYYMLGATLLAVIALIINFSRKISLHMIGAGSLTGLFLGLSLNFGINLTPELITAILLAGFIGYARLKSNSHEPPEIYSGYLLGVLTMALMMILI